MQQIANATAATMNTTETQIQLTVEFTDTLIKSLKLIYYAMIICVIIFAIGCSVVFYMTFYKRSQKEHINFDANNYSVSDNSGDQELTSCISHDSTPNTINSIYLENRAFIPIKKRHVKTDGNFYYNTFIIK